VQLTVRSLSALKTRGQGIAFDSWEAASVAKLYADGLHISLADFRMFSPRAYPEFSSQNLVVRRGLSLRKTRVWLRVEGELTLPSVCDDLFALSSLL
jgi:hypothetical protein